MVGYLCDLARVSRSGYYVWLKAAGIRKGRLEQDEKDILLLKEIFYKKIKKLGHYKSKCF